MDYETDLELCEYNPISVAYQEELRTLAGLIEAPTMSLFQRLMKKIILSHGANA